MNNLTAPDVRNISIVLDNTESVCPIKEGVISSPRVQLNFTEFKPVPKAFAPMVRNLAFDICEMAVVTFMQALDAGKPLRLLPVVQLGRMHHGSLFYNPSKGELAPADLKGRKVGVRAYTQTTGMWVRGILQEQYGVPLESVTWVTNEPAHVAEYVNPANVELVEGANLIEMLRCGEVAAIIIGASQVDGLDFKELIPDVKTVGAAWREKHKTIPINHMVAVTESFLREDPEAVREVYRMLCKGIDMSAPARAGEPLSAVGYGLDAIWQGGALQLAMQYALEQKLISRVFTKEELFADITL